MMNRKVDFFVLGAQKAASTSLCAYLEKHPDIGFSKHKEPNFFNHKYNQATQDQWNNYASLFDFNAKIIGEGSVNYSYQGQFWQTAKNIFEHNPNAKFIFMLRHPIDRLLSHYTYNLQRLLVKEEYFFWELTQQAEYLCRSRYYSELKAFFDRFPRSSFCFIQFEAFQENPERELQKVYQFLDCRPLQLTEQSKKNVSLGKLYHKSAKQASYARRPLVKILKRYVPQFLKTRWQKKNMQPIERPELSANQLAYLYDVLHLDIKAIQAYSGLDLSYYFQFNDFKYPLLN